MLQQAGRSGRAALVLFVQDLVAEAGAGDGAVERFHVTPSERGWERSLGKLYCGACNTMTWKGELPLPEPPQRGAWLLPGNDPVAAAIARHRAALCGLGWRVLSCGEEPLLRLSNKAALRAYAEELGLLAHLPEHFQTPAEARLPCVMKGAEGNYGQNVKIVRSREVLEQKQADWGSGQQLLQELIPGRTEFSCSLLVADGKVRDSVCMEYSYDRDEFVWPHVKEDKSLRRSHDRVPEEHFAVMRSLLRDYSGICNVNYKVRPSGAIAIFEVNTRIGGDLAEDVPRDRARAFFEALDRCEPCA